MEPQGLVKLSQTTREEKIWAKHYWFNGEKWNTKVCNIVSPRILNWNTSTLQQVPVVFFYRDVTLDAFFNQSNTPCRFLWRNKRPSVKMNLVYTQGVAYESTKTIGTQTGNWKWLFPSCHAPTTKTHKRLIIITITRAKMRAFRPLLCSVTIELGEWMLRTACCFLFSNDSLLGVAI